MKRKIFLASILIVATISCEDKNDLTDLTNQCEFQDYLFNNCFLGIGNSGLDGIIILDKKSYQEFGDSMRSDLKYIDCDTAELPNIDFDKFSLLSKSTLGSGCKVDYDRKILKDDENKEIIYKVSVEYSGLCDMMIGSWNWAIVPKIKNDYTVVFKFESH